MARIVSRAVILVLGAGYIGAKVAELALARGERVVLADNWHATRREQVEPLGAEVCDVDVRRRDDLDAVLARRPERVVYLAARRDGRCRGATPPTPSRPTWSARASWP